MRRPEALLLLAWLAAPAALPAADDLLAAVRGRIAALQPFRVEFTQQVYIDGEKEAEESGRILFHDAALLKWEYTRPERKVFLLAGGRYQFYQESGRQLLRGRLEPRRERLVWQLLASDEAGAEYACDPARRLITIRMHDGDGSIELRIRVGAAGLPQRAEQTDPSGVQQVFLFRGYRGPLATSAADFTLAVPPGTEIVDE